jgi:hypothetical protein
MKPISWVVFLFVSLIVTSNAFAQYEANETLSSQDKLALSDNPENSQVNNTTFCGECDTRLTSSPANAKGKMLSSFTYQTGDFGSDKRTHNVYIPFTVIGYLNKFALAGTLPYIYQKSDPRIAAVAGRPQQIRNASGPMRSDSGLGDLLAKGGYHILEEETYFANLWAIAQIKFPTAKDDEGLGTGEFDETLGVETSKSLDETWKVFLDFYYTFIGDPSGTDLNNQATFDIGLRHRVNDRTTLSVAYDDLSNLVDGQANPRDLILGIKHKTSDEAISFTGNINIGLSNGSPDFGYTIGVVSDF